MYTVHPPQKPDPGSGSDDLRVYKNWKGSNVSFRTVVVIFVSFCFLGFSFLACAVLRVQVIVLNVMSIEFECD